MFAAELDGDLLGAIRQTMKDGTLLGGESFRARVEARVQRRLTRLPHGGDRRGVAFRESHDLLARAPTLRNALRDSQ
jgi:hypothetical protein